MRGLLLRRQLQINREFWLHLVVYLVGIHGLYVIAITLLDEFRIRAGLHLTRIDIDVPLLIGIGLVYLATLLRRRKRTAWLVALGAYVFMLGFYAQQIMPAFAHHDWLQLVSKLGLPLLNIGLLCLYHRSFTVKSDVRSFGYMLRFIVLIVLTAAIYGVAGFMLMDKHDFHREIGFSEAVRQTADRFGLTSSNGFPPQTRRATLFVDSLSVVSIATVTVAAISLFQPIRARYTHRRETVALAEQLLMKYGGSSEDFFKLWPPDKTYYFDPQGESGVAYHPRRGVALVVSDPMGDKQRANRMLQGFEDLCFGNDWLPFFVHTMPQWNEFYTQHGYHLQKLGEEAVVDIQKFQTEVRQTKYFREISNKFGRKGYTTELLKPPHDEALISRLRTISDDWLSRPGRAERQLMMGYFNTQYLQQCPVLVARDSAGTIQAFLNQVRSFDPAEANFDMLRNASTALGNVNDYLLMAFIEHLADDTTLRYVNLGLCPLSGMDDINEKSVVSRTLHFIYANGDRFYSFSGLHRFKAKYQPIWRERSVAYKGGPASFARGMTALTRAMRVDKKLLGR